MNFSKGSEWRKWDLHLHTSSSYDYDYKVEDADELLCKALKTANLSAVAITDHFIIDAKRIKHLRELAQDIVFFPGVELRIDKCGANTHVVLIFPECSNLETLQEDFNSIMVREKAKSKNDNDKIFWNYDDVVDFAKKHGALISIHAGSKSNGIDKITNSIKVAEAIKEDIAKDVDLFEVGKPKDCEDYERIVFKQIPRKPLLICSDNHDPRNYILKENLWLKCDLTFEGLRQVCIHPEERAYIGKIPPHLYNVTSSPFHYLDEMYIFPKEESREVIWFNSKIQFNTGLVAIIGNKGSGKSALTDSIALAAGARTMDSASFLNKNRFKNDKTNYATNYMVQLRWADGRTTSPLCLNDATPSPEYVEYLPQRKIELICNELNNEFQDQIDSVIFSYIADDLKSGYSTLQDLLSDRYQTIERTIKAIQSNLQNKIQELSKLNLKRKPTYKKDIEAKIKYFTDLLESHRKTRPEKPTYDESSPATDELQKINNSIKEEEIKVKEIEQIIQEANSNITASTKFLNEYKGIIKEFKIAITNLVDNFSVSEIDKCKIMPNVSYDISEVSQYIKTQQTLISEKTKEKEALHQNLSKLLNDKDNLMKTVSDKERDYENYLEKERIWSNKLDDINKELSNYTIEKDYIATRLGEERDGVLKNILDLMLQIYDQILEKVKVYNQIYQPVGEEINKFLSLLDDKIEFVTSININKQFVMQLLRFVNQKLKSPLMGLEQGAQKLKDIIAKTKFNEKESFNLFASELLLLLDADECVDTIDKVLNTQEDFYTYLANLEYLNVHFELKLDGVSLESLSPGQRGSVLLVFYLALSKDKKPLIIDQPEDNLDNQSIYNKLVPCVLEAKKHRQIFLVTHNPNLAIACDAEQIIYCTLNTDNPKIRYDSGSIENPVTKQHVIDVLEGTEPAFTLRKNKYNIL